MFKIWETKILKRGLKLMKTLWTKICDFYYRTFYCSKFGHEWTVLQGTNKKICITCHEEYEINVSEVKHG